MKKLIYGSLFLALVGLGIVGCKKEQINPTQTELQKTSNEFGVSTDGKMLVFSTLADYEKAIDGENSDKRESLFQAIDDLKFQNYFSRVATKSDEENEMDDFLGKLLNTDGAIQIEDHVYKVDLKKEKVFVIEAVNKEADYNDLIAGNTSNKKVSEYSTEEDVIELVQAGIESQEKGLFCKEKQASNPNWKHTTWSNSESYTNSVNNSNKKYVVRYRRECKMNYLKLGIYFNLQAKLEVVGFVTSVNNTGTYGIDAFQNVGCITSIRSNRIYKIRCQQETGWNYVFSVLTNGSNLNKTEYNSYSGSKGLNRYWLKCGFFYKTNANNADIAVYPNLVGENVYQREIKSGY